MPSRNEKILVLTDKASCGLFQTQHEAALHYIPAPAHYRRLNTMGIQYCKSLSEEKFAFHFLATSGPALGKIHIFQGCGEQPD
jgi:hypothetical protein